MDIIIVAFQKLLSGIGPFFLLLGLLIFVHELGHYLVAVYFGVRVETFSLGFGKKIFSRKRGDTTYCISLIPLGGYVKMYGDDPSADIPEEQKKYSFLHKPVWPRIAIVLAGPIMNLIFAIFIFSAIAMLGEDVAGNKVGDIESGSAAHVAGFRSGDMITAINSSPVGQWKEIKEVVESSADKPLTFEVVREESKAKETVTATPELGKNDFIFSTQREVGKIEGLSTESVSTMVGLGDSKSLAAMAGLKTFDVIETVNGEEVSYWRQLEPLVKKHAASGKVTFTVSSYKNNDDRKKPETRSIEVLTTSLDKNKSALEQLGILRSDLFLLTVRQKSPAEKAGLRVGDLVTHVDGKPIVTWQSVLDRIKSFKKKEAAIEFTVVRNNTAENIKIAPEEVDLPTEQGAMVKRYAIGVVPAIMSAQGYSVIERTLNPIKAIGTGFEQAWVWSKLIAVSFVRLVQNEVSARNIGGVITIGRVASKSFEVGLVAFLKMMAIISINLFLLNLLPVPVLDGGHLVFFTLEAIKGAPISFKKLEIAQQVGLVLLLSLMLFALFNDISHLISSW
jgi:regulator of sigma E protease